jgi:hypothetical protein
MLSEPEGKLLVYASSFSLPSRRLKPVSMAVEKMAKLLRTRVQLVTFQEKSKQIYVYYKNGDDEPIPIYCDKGNELDSKTIYSTLRNMLFVLSFHPKHSGLKLIRKEIMQFS